MKVHGFTHAKIPFSGKRIELTFCGFQPRTNWLKTLFMDEVTCQRCILLKMRENQFIENLEAIYGNND